MTWTLIGLLALDRWASASIGGSASLRSSL